MKDHPYKSYEGTDIWVAVDKGIDDLIRNKDLIEQTTREHIVGYLCKVISETKK